LLNSALDAAIAIREDLLEEFAGRLSENNASADFFRGK
jgi:hypothetical protein